MATGTGVLAVLVVGLGIGVAAAQTNSGAAAAPGTIVCPTVATKLPPVPAEAIDEVNRNLALLNTQLAEANGRLVTTVGQGGPNFVNNAILGPLKDKRAATIDRIAIAIGRHAARPTNLGGLAGCQLVNDGGAAGQPEPTAATGAPTTPTGVSPGTIVCPSVAGKLPAIPAAARAEVDRNLALLDTQLAEANRRLATTVGQGGPNFVNNAILGPLKDKRAATIDRIAIAIGRHAPKPTGLAQSLSACTLVPR